MKSRILVVFLFVMVILTACTNDKGNEGKLNLDHNARGTKLSDRNVVKEVAEGDFVYRLVSEKSRYTEGEKVEVYAELEYVGNEPEIKIAHAASPFFFPMKEKTRNFEIGYLMNQPRIATVLKKGVPLRERYEGGGGYGSQDPKEYVDFIKAVAEASKKGTLPWGDYQVFGSAYFEPINGSEENQEKERLRLKAEIEFIVEKAKKVNSFIY